MKGLLIPILLSILGSISAPAADLHLRIVDSQEAVIIGATVEIRHLIGREKPVSGVTNKRGELAATVELPAEIRVSAPGFDSAILKVTTSSPEGLTIQLKPAIIHTTVEVVVRDAGIQEGTRERTALEIEGGSARTVFDAVDKLVPGAYVTRRGVMGYGIAQNGTGTVSIRGVGGSPNTQVLVVVDGRPDYMGLMGHPIPDFYTLSDVESLTVTQGPASVLYGSRAMGGVIEIKPKRSLEGFSTELTASFGSFYTGQHRLSHGAGFERGYYHLTAGIEHTSGDRPNSAFHDQDGTLALGYDLSASWKMRFQGRYGHFTVEDPGTVEAPTAGRYANVGRGGFSISVDNAASRIWGTSRFFSSYGHHMIWDGFRSVDDTLGARLEQNILISSQLSLQAGLDIVRYGGEARNIKSQMDYGNHYISETAGFSRIHYSPSRNLVLNAGFRYDHNSLQGGIVAPEFGATFRLADNYSFSLAAGKGFRNPTIRELYLFPAPNPFLQPEQLWNYQATFQANPAKSLLLWVTGYYASIDNLIVATGRFPNLQLENSGQALNRGLEINGRWQPIRRVILNGGYAYLRSTNLAPYIPEHKLNYSLDLDIGRALLSLGGNSVGRTWADSQRTRQLDEYTLIAFKSTFPLGRMLSAFVMIDNLLNRGYEVVEGYPMPGLNAMGGLNFKF